MLPRVNYPLGVATPDYLINGVGYDLKSITGTSKNALYNRVGKSKMQSNSFIIDISGCSLTFDETMNQIKLIFKSSKTEFVKNVVLFKSGKVIKAFKKNKN